MFKLGYGIFEKKNVEENTVEELYTSVVENMKAGNTKRPKGVTEFLIMKNPKIEKENRNKIWISYDTSKNRQMRTFRNIYGKLTDDIKELESKIGPTEPAIYSPTLRQKQIHEIKTIVLLVFALYIGSVLYIILGIPMLFSSILPLILLMILWELFMKKK